MKPVTVLIVDDEEPALQRIQMLLQNDESFALEGACLNGTEALQILATRDIGLLLLDIEMPGTSGLELLSMLPAHCKPAVVFVTAFDEYAVQAFEYYAVDYILKPFTNERFAKMLQRVNEHITLHAQNITPWQQVAQSIEQGYIPGRITVKTGRRYHFINPADVAYINASGNYCHIYLANREKHVLRDTLAHLSTLLPQSGFMRIHHSTIVATALVKQVKRLSFGDLEVLVGNTWLKASRKYKPALTKLIRP